MSEVIEKPDYGNWVPKKFIVIGLITSMILVLITIVINVLWLKIIFFVLAFLCSLMFLMVFRAYFLFSMEHGNLQGRVHDLLIKHLKWDGKGVCLDIGCGSAPVAIKLAKKFPKSKIIATDYWGETMFEYDKETCKKNAAIEQVADQIEFKHANAARLPFKNNSIDAVVSNLVFHEVKDFKLKEKHKSFIEALRVLKKGGSFAIQDVFGCKSIYGDFENLKKIISKEVSELNWIDTIDKLKIPKYLDNPIMMGGIGTFYGIK